MNYMLFGPYICIITTWFNVICGLSLHFEFKCTNNKKNKNCIRNWRV